MGDPVRVSYAGTDHGMNVHIVREWARGEISIVMSASSGPKYYVKNLIAMAFDAKPEIERIRMLIGEYKTSVAFLVFGIRDKWFDCSAKEVRFQ